MSSRIEVIHRNSVPTKNQSIKQTVNQCSNNKRTITGHSKEETGLRHGGATFKIAALKNQRQAEFCEFEVSLVYIASSRPARDIQ